MHADAHQHCLILICLKHLRVKIRPQLRQVQMQSAVSRLVYLGQLYLTISTSDRTHQRHFAVDLQHAEPAKACTELCPLLQGKFDNLTSKQISQSACGAWPNMRNKWQCFNDAKPGHMTTSATWTAQQHTEQAITKPDLQRFWAIPEEFVQGHLLFFQAVAMGEDQDAVAQQLTTICGAQVVQASHLFSSEAGTGGEHQQDGMDAAL